MAEKKANHKTIKGFLILGTILALAMLIFFLDDILRNLREPYRIVAVLPEAARVAALVTLPGDTRSVLRADSEIRLRRPTPLGAPVVEMMPGSAGAPHLRDGDTLRAPPTTRVEATLASAVEVYGELDSLVVASGTLLDQVAARRDDLAALERSIADASRELDQLRADVAAGPIGSITGDPRFQAHVASVQRNTAELARRFRARADELAAVMGTNGSDSLPSRAIAERIGALAARLERVALLLSSPTGTIGRLRTDSALIVALDSARIQLDSLIAEARRDPGRYIF